MPLSTTITWIIEISFVSCGIINDEKMRKISLFVLLLVLSVSDVFGKLKMDYIGEMKDGMEVVLMRDLGKITNDTLYFNPTTKMIEITGEGDVNTSTLILREVIKSMKVVVITNKNTTLDITNNSFCLPFSNPKSFSDGSGSRILHTPFVKCKYTDVNGVRVKGETEMVIIHELIHSLHNINGKKQTNVESVRKYYKSNREEEYTTEMENIIREELGYPLRGFGCNHKH